MKEQYYGAENQILHCKIAVCHQHLIVMKMIATLFFWGGGRAWSKCFIYVNSFNPHPNCQMSQVFITILQVGILRQRIEKKKNQTNKTS